MAFIGVPVIQKVTDKCWRLTGVRLLPAATGTIGFSDKTAPAEVSIHAPTWQPHELDGIVSLQDLVVVSVDVASDVDEAVPISVVKTGTTHGDFQIALRNTMIPDGGFTTGQLEIYIHQA